MTANASPAVLAPVDVDKVLARLRTTYCPPECYAAVEQMAADLAAAREENERLRTVAVAMLPVMEAMRPLVLNLERLRDAAQPENSRG